MKKITGVNLFLRSYNCFNFKRMRFRNIQVSLVILSDLSTSSPQNHLYPVEAGVPETPANNPCENPEGPLGKYFSDLISKGVLEHIDSNDAFAIVECEDVKEIYRSFGGRSELPNDQLSQVLRTKDWLISKYYRPGKAGEALDLILAMYKITADNIGENFKASVLEFLKRSCSGGERATRGDCLDDSTRWTLVEKFAKDAFNELQCMNLIDNLDGGIDTDVLENLKYYAAGDSVCSQNEVTDDQKLVYLVKKTIQGTLLIKTERIEHLSCNPLTRRNQDELEDCMTKMEKLLEIAQFQFRGQGFRHNQKPVGKLTKGESNPLLFIPDEQEVLIPRFFEAVVEYLKPKQKYTPENLLRAIGFPDADMMKARDRYERGSWKCTIWYRLEETHREETTKRGLFFDFLVCDAYYLLKSRDWKPTDLTNIKCEMFLEEISREKGIYMVQAKSESSYASLPSICERGGGALSKSLYKYTERPGDEDRHVMNHVDKSDTFANEMCTELNMRMHSLTEFDIESLKDDVKTSFIWLITKYAKEGESIWNKIKAEIADLFDVGQSALDSLTGWTELEGSQCSAEKRTTCLGDEERWENALQVVETISSAKKS